MNLSIETPATLLDMAELGGARTQLHWAVLKEMWSAGETFAWRDGDHLIGLLGLYPIEGGAEAWFNVRPEASPHMRFILRQIRLTLASRSYPEIVVFCGTQAGSRIARLIGLSLAERNNDGEIWHGSTDRWRWAETGETAGGAAAAADACRACAEPSGD